MTQPKKDDIDSGFEFSFSWKMSAQWKKLLLVLVVATIACIGPAIVLSLFVK